MPDDSVLTARAIHDLPPRLVYRAIKRATDIIVALVGLVLASPLLVLTALVVKFDSPGPVLFRQERIGRGFRSFRILKFRTMVIDAPKLGAQITAGSDPRITRVGRFLRKSKIDELPQLINVLIGDMSLVGPRPEVPKYVEMFRDDYRLVLSVRPGITDPASLKYRDEPTHLAKCEDPEQEYIARILPEKLALAHDYVRQSSLTGDFWLIFRTILAIVR